MLYKSYKSNSIRPLELKITRTLILTETKFIILSDYILEDTFTDIKRKYKKYKHQALYTIIKAKERTERDNRPLLNITNI